MRRYEVREVGPLTWWFEEDFTSPPPGKIPKWGLRFTMIVRGEENWNIVSATDLTNFKFKGYVGGWTCTETPTGKVWRIQASNASTANLGTESRPGLFRPGSAMAKIDGGELSTTNLKMVRELQDDISFVGERLGLRI